ncbi:hypothetical protein [Nostoc sp. LEGE 12450]|uniref:hypothetical protein n=1 Tax=Nostoc sp. LEGE 12450 TaxID=1828643 RepID=UPI00187E76AA|nr:hypothetical protein [Nostoc sp. LEGE 12450]MBE8989948.1 hypothetical protein [Nostoc sp. LEGE 12450]
MSVDIYLLYVKYSYGECNSSPADGTSWYPPARSLKPLLQNKALECANDCTRNHSTSNRAA